MSTTSKALDTIERLLKEAESSRAEVERLRVIETHARDIMRTANHHADADGRRKITVDSEPFNALEAIFEPVFAAERKACRAAKEAT